MSRAASTAACNSSLCATAPLGPLAASSAAAMIRNTAPVRGSRLLSDARVDIFRGCDAALRAVHPPVISAVNSSDGGFFAVVEVAAGSANGRSQLTMQLWCEPTMITTDVAGLEHFAREPDSR